MTTLPPTIMEVWKVIVIIFKETCSGASHFPLPWLWRKLEEDYRIWNMYIYIPRTQRSTSIFRVWPSILWVQSSKTRVIWVLGTYLWLFPSKLHSRSCRVLSLFQEAEQEEKLPPMTTCLPSIPTTNHKKKHNTKNSNQPGKWMFKKEARNENIKKKRFRDKQPFRCATCHNVWVLGSSNSFHLKTRWYSSVATATFMRKKTWNLHDDTR